MATDAAGWIAQTPIAHRGLHGKDHPENSLEAIEAAIEAGYAVEIDVRLSADDVPVVFHDETLERLTEHEALLAEMPWDQLEEIKILGTPSRIPNLARVLEVVDGQTGLLVEIKNRGAPGQLERRVLDVLDGYEGPLAVQSFNPRAMAWFREHAPGVARGQVASTFEGIPMDAWKRFLLQRLMLNWMSRPDFIAYEHGALPYWPVRLARTAGLPVLAWTLRSHGEHERVAPHVDNVIFEGYRP